MLNLVAALAPGSSAKMQVQRQSKALELTVTVGRRPKPQFKE
jgi:S1-C subfamily serine protease